MQYKWGQSGTMSWQNKREREHINAEFTVHDFRPNFAKSLTNA